MVPKVESHPGVVVVNRAYPERTYVTKIDRYIDRYIVVEVNPTYPERKKM